MSVSQKQRKKETIDSVVKDPEEDIIPDIESSWMGLRDADVTSVGDIDSEASGIKNSDVGEAGDIYSEGTGVKKSEVDKVGDIDSEKEGILKSIVGEVGDITNNTLGAIESSKAKSVGKINSGSTGISTSWDSDDPSIVGEAEDITAEMEAIEGSQVGRVGDIKTEQVAVTESDVYQIASIESDGKGIESSQIKKVGDIHSDRRPVTRSEIETIEGDIITGSAAIFNSEVDEIYGDIVAQQTEHVEGFLRNISEDNIPDIGNLREKERWIGGEAEKTYPIFHQTDLTFAVSDNIKGGELDRDSYGGFIAADEIEVDKYNNNMFVLTDEGSDQFTEYQGDFEELKDLLKNTEQNFEGIGTFNPDIDEIESKEKLLELENHYSQLLEDFETQEIRENIRYVQQFAEVLEDEQFVQMLEKATDTMQTTEKEKVKEFSETFSNLPDDIQDELVSTLEQTKDSQVGKDLFNIGRKREYNEFLEGEEYEITSLLDGGNRVIDGLSSISVPGSQFDAEAVKPAIKEMFKDQKIPDELGNFLKDQYLSARDGKFGNILRKIGRKEEYGELPEIDEESFNEESPYRELFEDAVNEYEDGIRFLTHLAEAAGEEYEPELGLKSKEGRRQHDPNFNPGTPENPEDEDFESLWEHVQKETEKDLENKDRAYIIQAVETLGEKVAREQYQEATGEDREPEELTENEIAALHAHSKYFKNTEAVEKLLEPGTEPAKLEENQRWLEEQGLKYDQITGFEPQEYEVKASAELQTTINEKRDEIIEEMQGLAEEMGEYNVENIEDVEELREEIERPSDHEKQQVYDELFKEKINEYRGIEDQVEGAPEQVTLRPAEPVEAIQMGNHFTNSCLAIGKSNGWSAAANALDANKQVLYAEDEDGEVVGRVLTAITENGELEDFKLYNNSSADIEEPVDNYIEQYADHLGLERAPEDTENKNIEVLEAEDWYDNAIY